MTDGEQSRDELDVQYGLEGPVHAAHQWVTAVREDKDLGAVWDRTTPAFRRKMVEAWVEANRNHILLRPYKLGELIEALCSDSRDHPLWEGFEQTQLDEFAEGWEEIDFKRWGYASRPRPVGVNQELVLLIDTGEERGRDDEPFRIEEETLMPGWGFLMEHGDDGWKVADVVGGEELTELTTKG